MNGRYTGFIDTTPATGPGHGIGVTGLPSNGTAGHLDGLRRALEPIELGLGDRLAWHAYADHDAPKVLSIALSVYGRKALNTKRKPRSSK